MKLNKKINLTLKQKMAIKGYLFISPFLIGFILFFLYPFIQSIAFSISELTITTGGFDLDFVGLDNYHHVFFINPDFNRIFLESISSILINLPSIIIFSFFIANLLNQKFKGRLLARTIFFLPVIVTSGVVVQLSAGDIMARVFAGGGGAVYGGVLVRNFLMQLALPEVFVEYIISAVNRIPEIINYSGIPILIFLAGLQSIPSSLFEAAEVEGATAWEKFWKITFPLLSPLFLTNIVFIVIDSFTSLNNPLVTYIQNQTWRGEGFGISVAMSWIYFLTVALILTIIVGIVSRKVFYME